MKLSNDVLLEIIAIVSDGFVGKKDASQGLRELDLVVGVDPDGEKPTTLMLSEDYLSTHPRATDWDDEQEHEPSAGEGSLN